MCYSVSSGYDFSKTVCFRFEQNSVLTCSYARKSSMLLPVGNWQNTTLAESEVNNPMFKKGYKSTLASSKTTALAHRAISVR